MLTPTGDYLHPQNSKSCMKMHWGAPIRHIPWQRIF